MFSKKHKKRAEPPKKVAKNDPKKVAKISGEKYDICKNNVCDDNQSQKNSEENVEKNVEGTCQKIQAKKKLGQKLSQKLSQKFQQIPTKNRYKIQNNNAAR